MVVRSHGTECCQGRFCAYLERKINLRSILFPTLPVLSLFRFELVAYKTFK